MARCVFRVHVCLDHTASSVHVYLYPVIVVCIACINDKVKQYELGLGLGRGTFVHMEIAFYQFHDLQSAYCGSDNSL